MIPNHPATRHTTKGVDFDHPFVYRLAYQKSPGPLR